MPITFPFEEDDDCATRILLFVFVLIVVADKLKENLQPVSNQYFIFSKSEIWSLSLMEHSKG